jgi:hypothetical protein
MITVQTRPAKPPMSPFPCGAAGELLFVSFRGAPQSGATRNLLFSRLFPRSGSLTTVRQRGDGPPAAGMTTERLFSFQPPAKLSSGIIHFTTEGGRI